MQKPSRLAVDLFYRDCYNTDMDKKITYKLTVRLFTEEKCFGPGVAMLLRRVQELHSLRAAAADLSMAYSKAWTILKNAERLMNCKLLISSAGGKHGGGATLTEEAVALLDAYDGFCRELNAFGEEIFEEKFGRFIEKL